jgi:small subunit ribosomal protein S6
MKFNKFETVIVIRTDITEDTIEAFHAKVFDALKRLGGHEVKFEVWGKRKLAYEIKKNMKGIYIYYLYLAPPAAIDELERTLRLNELVLRFLTVHLAENVDPDHYDLMQEADLSFKRMVTEEDEAAAEAAKPADPNAKPADGSEPAKDGDDDEDDEKEEGGEKAEGASDNEPTTRDAE